MTAFSGVVLQLSRAMSEYDWNLVASALSDDRIFFDVPLGPALANTIPNAGWFRSSSTVMS